MSRQTTVRVMIFGTEFTFRTDDPEYIRELAGFVDEQIQSIASRGRVISPTKAISLAAFNIADELFKLRKERDEVTSRFSERLDSMLDMAQEAYRSEDGRAHS